MCRAARDAFPLIILSLAGCGERGTLEESAPAARSPFGSVELVPEGPRLVVRDGEGLSVLESVGEGRREAGGVAYRAFGFTTAAEPELVPPSLEEVAAVGEPPAGTRFSANALIEVVRTGDAVSARLATDDPAGRALVVTLSGDVADTLRVEVAVDPPEGVTSVDMAFRAGDTEVWSGLGGRRETTNLRGLSVATWVLDYRFPDVSPAYYAPHTAVLSSAGYALWVDTDHLARFRLASDLPDALRIAVAAPRLAVVVAPGDAGTSLRAITEITGRHRLPPEWSQRACLSRTIQILGFSPEGYQAKVEADVQRLTAAASPFGSYAYEGAATLPEAVVRDVNARLVAAGIRPLAYLRSFVANDAAGTEEHGLLDEAIARRLVATHADGSAYLFPSPFDGSDAAVLDYTNPETRAFWAERVTRLLDRGAEGFMNDFGEQVLPDMRFADGTTGVETHNRYPVLQHRATREAVDAYEATHPGRQVYFFGRAGYSGRPGSVAFEGAAFPGDESVDFDRLTGLPAIVPDMLNRALFGAYGFSTDIGGYADFVGGPDGFVGTDEELFLRWSEAAVFTTHFRVHNSALSGLREPWAFGPETEARWNALAALHERAVPYIRELWASAGTTGLPPIRPMFLVDEAARAAAHSDDQWMVGKDVVVAPVLERGATEREVWLPEGEWLREGLGEPLEGGRLHRVSAPPGTLPWFTRKGTEPLRTTPGAG